MSKMGQVVKKRGRAEGRTETKTQFKHSTDLFGMDI